MINFKTVKYILTKKKAEVETLSQERHTVLEIVEDLLFEAAGVSPKVGDERQTSVEELLQELGSHV